LRDEALSASVLQALNGGDASPVWRLAGALA
jgi:hypothetical protein